MADHDSSIAAGAGTIDVGGDLTVGRLGFGAMRITGRGIWGDPPDHDEALAVLRRVVELGVDFIDTADSYGPHVSEQLIAEALHPYPENLVIATKGGLERPGPGRWTPNGRPDYLRKACEDSLRRLRLEQIPLHQFHRPDPQVPLEDSIGTLVELRDEGKVRHIGLSNVTEEQLRRAQQLTPIASIQNRYNLTDRGSESLVDLCEQEHIAFIPWAPIQGLEDVDLAGEIAARHNATDRQVALAWLLARSPAMLVIPGTASRQHLDDNVAAAGLQLSAEEVADAHRRRGLTGLGRELTEPVAVWSEEVSVGQIVERPAGQSKAPGHVGDHLHRGRRDAGSTRRQLIPALAEPFEQLDSPGRAGLEAIRTDPAEPQESALIVRSQTTLSPCGPETHR